MNSTKNTKGTMSSLDFHEYSTCASRFAVFNTRNQKFVEEDYLYDKTVRDQFKESNLFGHDNSKLFQIRRTLGEFEDDSQREGQIAKQLKEHLKISDLPDMTKFKKLNFNE